MMRDRDLEFLLSGCRLAPDQRAGIGRAVVAASARRQSRPARMTMMMTLRISLLAGVAGLAGWRVTATRASFSGPAHGEDSAGFRTRAGSIRPGVGLDLHCVDGDLDQCRLGSTLLFAADQEAPEGFLHAYAEDPATGERIWYFSGASEAPFIGPSRTREQIVERAVRLGHEHRPGLYKVTLVLAGAVLGPHEVAEPAEGAIIGKRTFSLRVVGRE